MPTNAALIATWKAEDTLNDRTRLAALLNAILPDGLAGKKIVFGDAAFSTTDTTVEVPAYTAAGDDLTAIDAIVAIPKATGNADEPFFCDGVVTVNGSTGDNTTTVERLAGTTSALPFWFIIIGS